MKLRSSLHEALTQARAFFDLVAKVLIERDHLEVIAADLQVDFRTAAGVVRAELQSTGRRAYGPRR